MLSKKIFETDLKTALETELTRRGMSIKELAEKAKIPVATIYKITSGGRDPRFSTVKKIVNVLEPRVENVIAIIASKFLLDEIKTTEIKINNKKYKIRGYSANSVEDCIVSAALAEKEGASGIICAPILASVIEKIVDIPVAIMKPRVETLMDAIETVAKRIG
ncbi:MAG: helix-turn-helix domain-containing protein [Candidatus Bathyarchaeia archaeon]